MRINLSAYGQKETCLYWSFKKLLFMFNFQFTRLKKRIAFEVQNRPNANGLHNAEQNYQQRSTTTSNYKF